MSESGPEYPKTFEELKARHAEIAMELSGAGQSAWNGTLIETDSDTLGVANWDGSLELDREAVTEPLRDMYSSPGEQRDDATLTEYRDAFATLLHEQSHFLGPEGASQDEASIAFQELGAQALEEGVTEAWTQDNLDEYLQRTGADEVAPGIEAATSESSYPEFVPAARELASGIGEQAGMTQGEVLTELNNQTAEGQWSRATELLYESSDLPELVPPDQEASVKQGIEQKMREEFGRLNGLDEDSPNLEAQSAAIGQDSVAAGVAEAERQQQVFAPPAAETQQILSSQTQPELSGPDVGAEAQASAETQAGAEVQAGAEAQAGAAGQAPAGADLESGSGITGADSTPAVGQGVGMPETPAVGEGAGTPGGQAVGEGASATGAPAIGEGAGATGAAVGEGAGPTGAPAVGEEAGTPGAAVGEGSGAAGAAVGDGAGTAGRPARVGAQGAGRGAGERDADHALRLAMEGQRPMSSSVRLSENSFGTRRGGGQGAGQAHGQSQRPTGPGTGRGE